MRLASSSQLVQKTVGAEVYGGLAEAPEPQNFGFRSFVVANRPLANSQLLSVLNAHFFGADFVFPAQPRLSQFCS